MTDTPNPYESPADLPQGDAPPDDAPTYLARAQNQVIWTIWLTYGAFYFCRTNIAAARPGLMLPIEEGGLGLSDGEIGWILGSLKIAYAAGQLINGQLSEQLSPRRMLAIGMFGSALLNVTFGFATAAYFLLFIWAMNGYCQSLGWTPCVRVLANWIPVMRRGWAIGIVGTGYQLTAALTFIVAGYSAERFGWQGALWVPAAILAAAGIFMFFFLKESPKDLADDSSFDDAEPPHHTPPPKQQKGSLLENLISTLSNPALWVLGISLGLVNACRYGYMDWGLSHLLETQKDGFDEAGLQGLGKAGLKIAVLPLGGIAGSFLTGWATDRFFGGRRAPVICVLLLSLGAMTWVYPQVVEAGVVGTLVMLVAIGFCIYGPQVLLVGTAPADLARQGTSAAAAGFVNCMGYIGAALVGDILTGYLLENYGWETTIHVWAACALVAAGLSALLWNATEWREQR